jgi:glycerate 2-kinase
MDTCKNAIDIFMHAVEAVKPSTLIHNYISLKSGHLCIDSCDLPIKPANRVLVIGAGKASALMAQTVEEILGDVVTDGIVVTKHRHGLPLNRVRLIEAGHPVPDLNSIRGTEELLKLVNNLRGDDIVIFLLSRGTGSI